MPECVNLMCSRQSEAWANSTMAAAVLYAVVRCGVNMMHDIVWKMSDPKTPDPHRSGLQ
jgi:hypothetical protein